MHSLTTHSLPPWYPSAMRHCVQALLIACLAMSAVPAVAADFYVDPVNGSDTGDGSAANPWRTLQAVIQANRIETRNWESLPYQPGLALVTVNAGAPVRAGDTLWLRSGYHGAVVIRSAYNATAITIAAQPGHVPRLRSLLVESAQNWVVRGLSVSPSHAPPLTPAITVVNVRDHNWFGPAWDVTIDGCDVFTVDDASAWTATDWVTLASSGVGVGADRVTVRASLVRNVRFGISVSGRCGPDPGEPRSTASPPTACAGSATTASSNTTASRTTTSAIRRTPTTTTVSRAGRWGRAEWGRARCGESSCAATSSSTSLDPAHPLRSSMQAIGCFDGFFVDWVVENNVVVTDHWHGISFLGMRDSRIVNNTVIDVNQSSPGPPWIMVAPHKDGRPSENVVVRNNLATDFSLAGIDIVADHNLEFTNAAALFLAPPYDLRLRPGTAAVDTGSEELAPPIDVEGVRRPQGGGIDLGAHERCRVVGPLGNRPCPGRPGLPAADSEGSPRPPTE